MVNLKWHQLLKKLADANCLGIGSGVHRILIYGPPGVGKSAWPVMYYGADKVSKVIMHKRLQPDELVGGLLINEKGATVSNPQHAAVAMLEGRPLVIDEIDRTSPDVVCLLHAILDDPQISRVPLADGRVISPANGFMVFATMNGHPDSLPEALRDRFELILQATDPAPGIFDNMPRGLAKVLEANMKAAPVSAWVPSIGVRPIQAARRLAETKQFSMQESIQVIFGEKVGRQIADSVAAQS